MCRPVRERLRDLARSKQERFALVEGSDVYLSKHMSSFLRWVLHNPDRVLEILVSIVAFILRFTSPGTRVQAFFTALSIDLVKLYTVIAKKPLPGGFSPAPADIPMTSEGAEKMAKAAGVILPPEPKDL